MSNQTVIENIAEDIQEAISSSRPVRSHGPYRIQIGDDRLEFKPSVIDDPVPTGLQILEVAEARPTAEHLVFQVLKNGMLEELRPDETTDLRTKGVEKFLVFRNDRSFRFELDGRMFEWGGTLISGATLKNLAGVDSKAYGVWLEVRGAGDDRPITDSDLVDLSVPGVERFFTGIVQTTEGMEPPILPMRCRRYLTDRGMTFEEVQESGQQVVVLRNFALPMGRFDAATADVLIYLPAGYPDNAPDMFYCQPWLKLVSVNRYPNNADQPQLFRSLSWQRWSRHNSAWRPGVDGIWTMVKRIENALQEAA